MNCILARVSPLREYESIAMTINSEADIIDSLSTEQMRILFLPSPRAEHASAWHGHIAFAGWLVSATRPGIIVELGTHAGVSYAAFCQAVKELSLNTKCFAVDTWSGDAHSELYDSKVYDELSSFNSLNYSSFSVLVRELFDNAIDYFEDGSIDLLHIDGFHTYKAVKSNFYDWMPKLSDKAVVVFHDTEVRVQNFGVYEFWKEISEKYPSFSFKHSAGLGIISFGNSVSDQVLSLCRRSELEAAILEKRFESLSKIANILGSKSTYPKFSNIYGRSNNIALNCSASQSSHYGTPAPTPQGAVNGHKTGTYGFHTAYEQGAWWQVDLGEQKPIREILIYNRMDPFCKERAASLEVFTSNDMVKWESVYAHNGKSFGGIDGYPLAIQLLSSTTRFVKIQLREPNFLHLDEVEIY